ncbi:hypothetical protein [Rhizobium sp. BK176]|uniref:hypothetical protein n=1 Tax=Rhizobium sp. BK176 TaxID=2587071 RepID=UPI002169171E|nr:hypothetical protein [Rhizobium sp. BK176]MCS4088541.1 hypothetical protein [Rhizobium sp. BK176]
MTFEFDHERMRQLAKALSARTNREIKLGDIYNDIASVFGMKGDAMMHALKSMPGLSAAEAQITPVSSLADLSAFSGAMLCKAEARKRWYCGVCVVYLASLEGVEARSDVEGAEKHRSAFIRAIAPGPRSEVVISDLGDGFFALGLPCVDSFSQVENHINRRMAHWEAQLLENGEEPDDFELSAFAYVFDETSIKAERIDKAIADGKPKAVNIAKARRELDAFPRLRFDSFTTAENYRP